MNFEIKKENWPNFFDTLSKRRYEWKTRIEVLNAEIGDQVLSDGLRLNGITSEANGDRVSIEILVGADTDAHQTHSIQNPTRVAFLEAGDNHGDVIDIEEEDGTKTLITFVEPMGILIGFMEAEVAASVG